jgi:hypothetical protein
MRAKLPILLCVTLLSSFAACGGDDAIETTPPVVRPEPTLPTAPAQNDAAFAVSKLRSWYLIGNALTAGHDDLSVEVIAPAGVEVIDLWLDGERVGELSQKEGVASLTTDIKALAVGEHEVLLAADSATTAFARFTFNRSHPFYVITTTDWDDPDNTDNQLALQEELHKNHPELKLTHFVGPYTFTDPIVTPERRKVLADWVKGMRDTYGDEIGLHIHPYCNFIETTTVPCRTEPSLAYADGDLTGYSVVLSSYTEDEFATILKAADALFVDNGLGKPTSFRAGGWSAEAHTLRALASTGYVADTSAVNWARLEEWKGLPGTMLYEWNKEHWATIGDTSQPYHPNEDDALSSEAPTLSILQVPDNGALVDYVKAAEMIEIFTANWPGGALPEPRQLSVGYHPPNFTTGYKNRMDELFTHVDQFLISADKGPVVYETLSPMAVVWPATIHR